MEAINKHCPAFRLRPGPPRVLKARRSQAFLNAAPAVPRGLADRNYALARFRSLMERLDRWLDAPVRGTRNARGHTVWLVGAIGYRVDSVAKEVYPVFRDGTRRG